MELITGFSGNSVRTGAGPAPAARPRPDTADNLPAARWRDTEWKAPLTEVTVARETRAAFDAFVRTYGDSLIRLAARPARGDCAAVLAPASEQETAHALGNSVGTVKSQTSRGDFAAKRGAFRYWVDAKTFRPVEMQFPPFTAASTITIAWIPKTPALVHQTNTPHVPDGYRKVTAPAWFS